MAVMEPIGSCEFEGVKEGLAEQVTSERAAGGGAGEKHPRQSEGQGQGGQRRAPGGGAQKVTTASDDVGPER